MNATPGSTAAIASNPRDFYDDLYRTDIARQAEWLRRTAPPKVDSIELLLRSLPRPPRHLAEIGCGSGAVLLECKARQLAKTFTGIEYSAAALDFLRSQDPAIPLVCADVTSGELRLDEPPDLVVCSHVIEHLEDPAGFLKAMCANIPFEYAILEVPLEDLPLHRLKWAGRNRLSNSAGHVQFFTATTFKKLLAGVGLEVIDQRRYVPILDAGTLDFIARDTSAGRITRWLRRRWNHDLPALTEPVWSRLYYSHYAVLCRRATARGSESPAAAR